MPGTSDVTHRMPWSLAWLPGSVLGDAWLVEQDALLDPVEAREASAVAPIALDLVAEASEVKAQRTDGFTLGRSSTASGDAGDAGATSTSRHHHLTLRTGRALRHPP